MSYSVPCEIIPIRAQTHGEMAAVVADWCGFHEDSLPSLGQKFWFRNPEPCRRFEVVMLQMNPINYMEHLWAVCQGDDVDSTLAGADPYMVAEAMLSASCEQRVDAAYRFVVAEKL